MITESGSIVGQLKNTQDFIVLLTDLQKLFASISLRALPNNNVGSVNEEWEKTKDQLMADWKKVWAVLNESPIWRELVVKSKALGNEAAKVGEDTKEQAEKAADKIANSAQAQKLKEDFKNVLQLSKPFFKAIMFLLLKFSLL